MEVKPDAMTNDLGLSSFWAVGRCALRSFIVDLTLENRHCSRESEHDLGLHHCRKARANPGRFRASMNDPEPIRFGPWPLRGVPFAAVEH